MAGVGNLDFIKKLTGILHLCQLVLGIICLALSANYSYTSLHHIMTRNECFFLTVAISFFTVTVLLIINGLSSTNAEERMHQTLFEPMYHILAVILYFSGSVALLVDADKIIPCEKQRGLLAAGSFGVINTVLYGVSAFYSYMAYINN